MNEFNILGVALDKPEVFNAESGKNYGKLIVTVKKQFKNKDGEIDNENFQLTLFKNCLDEVGEKIKAGTPLFVNGRVQANNFDKDGKLFYGTNLIADRIEIADDFS